MAEAMAASLTDNRKTKWLLKSEKQIVASKLPDTHVIGKDVAALGNCMYDSFFEAYASAEFELFDKLGCPPGVYTASVHFTPAVALRNQTMDVVENNYERFQEYLNTAQHSNIVEYAFRARCDANVWGCEVTLHALVETFNVDIHVYNSHPHASME